MKRPSVVDWNQVPGASRHNWANRHFNPEAKISVGPTRNASSFDWAEAHVSHTYSYVESFILESWRKIIPTVSRLNVAHPVSFLNAQRAIGWLSLSGKYEAFLSRAGGPVCLLRRVAGNSSGGNQNDLDFILVPANRGVSPARMIGRKTDSVPREGECISDDDAAPLDPRPVTTFSRGSR